MRFLGDSLMILESYWDAIFDRDSSFRDKISRLFKSPFIKNVSIVASGSVVAQGIGIAFSPVITRLYGPEAFGILGVFIASSAILVTVCSLTYQIAIVLPKKDDDAKAIAVLSFIIAAALSSVIALILFLFRQSLISLLHLEEISAFIFLIPVFIMFAASHKIIEQWIIRKGEFKKKAKVGIAQALIVNTTKSGIGLVHPAALILVIISTFGHLLHTFLLSWTLSKKIFIFKYFKNKSWLRLSKIKEVAIRYKDFPSYRAPQALLGSFTKNLPMIIIASFFGPVYAGFYGLGQKVIKHPAGIISDSVGKVFYPWISKAYNEGKNIRLLLTKATLALAGIGIIPFGAIILFGPFLFGFIFGNEWVNAGEYSRWLSVWLFFDFIRVSAVQTIPVIGIQGFFLIFTMISTIIRVLTLFLAALITKDAVLTIAIFSIISGLLSLLLLFITISKCNKKPFNVSF
jgi:O-antigen/teichoic acid export membrane protein